MGSDLLSQDEIDALLHGVSGDDIDTGGDDGMDDGSASSYDFNSQDRIVRGRLPVLDKISARFVRHLQDGLEHLLQRPVEVSMDGLQTVRCADYIHSLGVPVSVNFMSWCM